MVDVVSTVGGSKASAPIGQPVSHAQTSSNVGTAAKVAGVSTSAVATTSSRVYVDPTAGGIVVSEQLNADGSIAQQVPSASVLAYLENGLTIQGYSKQSTTA